MTLGPLRVVKVPEYHVGASHSALRAFAFAAFIFFSVAIGWGPLSRTFSLAIQRDEYTYIILILPISLTFVVAEWKSVQLLPRRRAINALPAFFAAAAFVALTWTHHPWLTSDVRLSIQMLALITYWVGSFVLFWGTAVFRKLLVPLLFLYGMVPVPEIVLNTSIEGLQRGSAMVARLLFGVAGIPVAQNGMMLTIPGLTIEVAKECSSIRSSLLLLITTMLLAQVMLRSPLSKILAIAIALPGTRVDAGFLTGRLHRQGGIVFFLISLLLIFLMVRLLEVGEKSTQRLGLRQGLLKAFF